jgi:hypothetical protein
VLCNSMGSTRAFFHPPPLHASKPEFVSHIACLLRFGSVRVLLALLLYSAVLIHLLYTLFELKFGFPLLL